MKMPKFTSGTLMRRSASRLRDIVGAKLGFNAQIQELNATVHRLAPIEAKYDRWLELAPLIEAILALDASERQYILSGALGVFDVGKRNAPDRDLWVEKTLKALPSGWRLLDAGAGECQYKMHCAHLNYISQDVAVYDASSDVGLQNPGWSFSGIDIVSDIVDIPQPDASFDAVLCTEVLEHLPDPVRALDEMSRLLKPGGMLIITAPFWSLTHQAPFHFSSGFNRYFYDHHFQRLGLDVVEMTPNGNFFECLGQELRRVPSMLERFSQDPPSRLDLMGMQIVLRMVHQMALRDQGTAELLNYGFHVRARKVEAPS